MEAVAATPNVVAVSKSPAPSKARKDSSAVKRVPLHPSYNTMIKKAISELKDRKGTSRQAIVKYIRLHFKVAVTEKVETKVRKALKEALLKGELTNSKGAGATGSFKLTDASKLKEKFTKKAAIKAARKSIKKAAITTVKKSKQSKSPKKATEKVSATTKKSPKKLTQKSPKKLATKSPKKVPTKSPKKQATKSPKPAVTKASKTKAVEVPAAEPVVAVVTPVVAAAAAKTAKATKAQKTAAAAVVEAIKAASPVKHSGRVVRAKTTKLSPKKDAFKAKKPSVKKSPKKVVPAVQV